MDAINPKSQFIGFPTKKWSVNVDPKFGCSVSPGLQDSAIATDHQGDHHILRHAALFVLADIESPNVVPACSSNNLHCGQVKSDKKVPSRWEWSTWSTAFGMPTVKPNKWLLSFFPRGMAGYVALNQDMYIINSIFRTDSCIKSLSFQP